MYLHSVDPNGLLPREKDMFKQPPNESTEKQELAKKAANQGVEVFEEEDVAAYYQENPVAVYAIPYAYDSTEPPEIKEVIGYNFWKDWYARPRQAMHLLRKL
jgi:hypothetical protein